MLSSKKTQQSNELIDLELNQTSSFCDIVLSSSLFAFALLYECRLIDINGKLDCWSEGGRKFLWDAFEYSVLGKKKQVKDIILTEAEEYFMKFRKRRLICIEFNEEGLFQQEWRINKSIYETFICLGLLYKILGNDDINTVDFKSHFDVKRMYNQKGSETPPQPVHTKENNRTLRSGNQSGTVKTTTGTVKTTTGTVKTTTRIVKTKKAKAGSKKAI